MFNQTFFRSVFTLWQRELIRFVRQRARLFGAFGTPLVFWLLIGSGLGESFQPPGSTHGMTYLEYFYPGTILLIILFTAIFSSLSIIEDRKEGFLLSVLVAPVSRQAIALGKILGSATLAFLQGLLLLCLAPLLGLSISWTSYAILVGLILLISLSLSALGFLTAWKTESMQGYHSIMNVLLFPMWLLSGAIFPIDGAFTWVKWLMTINPLTYALAALQHVMYAQPPLAEIPPFLPSLVITALFGLTVFFLSVLLVRRGHLAGLD